jgi:hypothetical protein
MRLERLHSPAGPGRGGRDNDDPAPAYAAGLSARLPSGIGPLPAHPGEGCAFATGISGTFTAADCVPYSLPPRLLRYLQAVVRDVTSFAYDAFLTRSTNADRRALLPHDPLLGTSCPRTIHPSCSWRSLSGTRLLGVRARRRVQRSALSTTCHSAPGRGRERWLHWSSGLTATPRAAQGPVSVQ